jgi:polyisoprenoid-binding protein YceI
MRIAARAVAAVVLAVVSCSALAAQTSVQLDPASTQIHYKVGTLLHTVHGTFRMTKGMLQFDPRTGVASGEIDIDAASGNSENGSRDKKMNKEVLESQNYPTIVFLPQHIVGVVNATSPSNIQVKGIFRIHGRDHEMTMPVTVTPASGAYAVETKFNVPYVAWGMKNPSTFVLTVEKTVEITIDSKATLAAATAN